MSEKGTKWIIRVRKGDVKVEVGGEGVKIKDFFDEIAEKYLNSACATTDLRESNAWIEHMTEEDFKEFKAIKNRAKELMEQTKERMNQPTNP
jgi:hypothetical protein